MTKNDVKLAVVGLILTVALCLGILALAMGCHKYAGCVL